MKSISNPSVDRREQICVKMLKKWFPILIARLNKINPSAEERPMFSWRKRGPRCSAQSPPDWRRTERSSPAGSRMPPRAGRSLEDRPATSSTEWQSCPGRFWTSTSRGSARARHTAEYKSETARIGQKWFLAETLMDLTCSRLTDK